MAQAVDGDAFPFERRTAFGSERGMPDQQLMYAVGAETGTSGIGEQDLPVAARRFA